MIKYVGKANDDVLSFCTCQDALADVPGQLDCPWCGCGWMIGCMKCRKAFVYGRVVEIDSDYVTLVREDTRTSGFERDADEIRDIAEWMGAAMADFEVGQMVVYLDGYYLPIDTAGEIEGLYARHTFSSLPHKDAHLAPGVLEATLGDVRYWTDRERPERD